MRRVFCYSAIVPVVLATACFPGGLGELGPFEVTVEAGRGSLPRDFFPAKQGLTLSREQPVCSLPSEDEISDEYMRVGDVDVSRFVRLSRVELQQTVFTATQGDFNFLSGLAVWYRPAPVNGEEQDAILLGSATNPEGLGAQVVLTPPDTVDFLELIRENDANRSDECPELVLELTIRSVPLQNIEYRVDTTFDAYAWVGIFRN